MSRARRSKPTYEADADNCEPLPQATAATATSPGGSSKSSARGWAIALIIDAGPLYAYVDGDDAHHGACLELLETHPGPLIVPTLVITEVVYLIASRLGWQAETRFLGDLAGGEMSLEPVDPADTLRIAELVARYHDLPLGTVDASVIAAAERLGATEVATLDRRHFTVIRPRHVEAFNLLPGRV
jgi:predicted nucleic acid-binding protein